MERGEGKGCRYLFYTRGDGGRVRVAGTPFSVAIGVSDMALWRTEVISSICSHLMKVIGFTRCSVDMSIYTTHPCNRMGANPVPH